MRSIWNDQRPTPSPAARTATSHDLESDLRYLHGYAMSRVRDPALADDLVQETLLVAMERHGAFEGRSGRRTWLVGILKHKLADVFRNRAREPATVAARSEDSDIDGGEEFAVLLASDASSRLPGPERDMRERRLWAAFERHLSMLPPRTARAFVLGEILGHDVREVAGILGAPRSSVWTMVHNASKHLRTVMKDALDAA